MKNSKKVSHTGYWRAMYKADELAVLSLTGMTTEELMDLKLDMGREWLIKQLADHHFKRLHCERLWGTERVIRWWLLNWRNYDHYNVLPILQRVIPEDRLDTYKDMHLNTFRDNHPRKDELREQLAGLLELLTKEEVQHASATC